MPGESFARRVVFAPDLNTDPSRPSSALPPRATGPFPMQIWLTKRGAQGGARVRYGSCVFRQDLDNENAWPIIPRVFRGLHRAANNRITGKSVRGIGVARRRIPNLQRGACAAEQIYCRARSCWDSGVGAATAREV